MNHLMEILNIPLNSLVIINYRSEEICQAFLFVVANIIIFMMCFNGVIFVG